MSSRAFSIAAGLLLLLSLAGKTAAAAGDPKPDPAASVAAAKAMFAAAGFAVDVRSLERSPKLLAEATAGDCRILAGEYPVHDTFADVYRNLAAVHGRLVYAHDGALHESPPKTRSMIRFFVWRELRRVGIPAARAPVVALIASPECAMDGFDWSRLARVDA